MDRPVRGRDRGGRGHGRGRVPRPRADTRANAAPSSAGSGSQSENQSHHSEPQRQEPVDPCVMMQVMMVQMTQMGQLMETMQRAATVGQQQGQQPPPNGSVVSRKINDISRQRPPIFEGSSEPADIIHWIDYFEKLFEMLLNHHCTTLVEFIERALENELTAKEVFKKPQSIQNSSAKEHTAFNLQDLLLKRSSQILLSIIVKHRGISVPVVLNLLFSATLVGNLGIGPDIAGADQSMLWQSRTLQLSLWLRSELSRLHLIRLRGLIKGWAAVISVVTVTASDGLECIFQGDNPNHSGRVISAMKAVRLLNQGCVGFWCYMTKTTDRPPKLADIPIVQDFPDVFPEELPGLPPTLRDRIHY
ncbi:hypothetical protein OROGR_009292 [Orobanche gracilis]